MKTVVSNIRNFLTNTAEVWYHIVILILGAGIALSLPVLARSFLGYWAKVEHEKMSVISLEIGVAVVLILFFNYLRRSLQARGLAKAAIGAGLVSFFPKRGRAAQRVIRKLKEKHGTGRTVMAIGSSGYGTFVDQVGDLSTVLETCQGAKILLVNPYSPEASKRIEAIGHPDLTVENYRAEVRQSIALLKRLKAIGKAVKLKLYSDPPLIKLVILGDYLWLQHYHSDLGIQSMPEYVLQHNQHGHGLYTLCYQYFVQRWESSRIPEYDLDTDELVYRGRSGSEVKRVRFAPEEASEGILQDVEPVLSRI